MEANDPVKPESTKTIKLHIKRQDSPEAKSRYEDFEIEWHPNMNVVSALMAIRAHPVLADGTPTTPVVWESVCLEEVCGACTMLINGAASMFDAHRFARAAHHARAAYEVPARARSEGRSPEALRTSQARACLD